MKISDIQYIESANEEVLGGSHNDHNNNGNNHNNGNGKPKKPSMKKRRPFNQAGADAVAEAFGFNTKAFTKTDTLVISGEFSGASSSSYSESF